MLYPLKFEPVYKSLIWGGNNIERKFKRQLPQGRIGESWEICCRSNGMSIVSNGSLKGKTLEELIEIYKEDLLGCDVYSKYSDFPLLIKIIDANDKLSVQVHPDDEYARKCNEKNGKNEIWYILDARPEAKLIYGLKGCATRDDLLNAIKNNDIKNYLNEIPVKPGDALYIPAGKVHAILDGIMVAEIQQDSDTTYRLYDWDRVDSLGNPRELHIEKALDVINFEESCVVTENSRKLECSDFCMTSLSQNEYFNLDNIKIKDSYKDMADGSKFHIYFVIEGNGTIEFSKGREELCPGCSLFVPACLGEYIISGRLNVLKTYI